MYIQTESIKRTDFRTWPIFHSMVIFSKSEKIVKVPVLVGNVVNCRPENSLSTEAKSRWTVVSEG